MIGDLVQERDPDFNSGLCYWSSGLCNRRPILQRRVKAWKVIHGPSPEVMFELRHEPGVMGISDFTQLKGMTITISGEPFEHMLYHYRLTYSGWQYAQII